MKGYSNLPIIEGSSLYNNIIINKNIPHHASSVEITSIVVNNNRRWFLKFLRSMLKTVIVDSVSRNI